MEGITAKGLPLSQRGGLTADFAALRIPAVPIPVAAIDIIARIPIAERTFIDVILPIGFGAIGNPMVGAHHVFRPAERVWINFGGAFGVPLINADRFQTFQLARAFWDMGEFSRSTVPFVVRAGLEAHTGIFELRVQLEPVWGVSVEPSPSLFGSGATGGHLFALQHALELQLGHAIGGGIRYQGVAIATNTLADNSGGAADHYQGAVELFFRLYRDPIFARLGFVVPLDSPLGAVNGSRTWGVHVQTGFNLD